jgi:hypothetical protein
LPQPLCFIMRVPQRPAVDYSFHHSSSSVRRKSPLEKENTEHARFDPALST